MTRRLIDLCWPPRRIELVGMMAATGIRLVTHDAPIVVIDGSSSGRPASGPRLMRSDYLRPELRPITCSLGVRERDCGVVDADTKAHPTVCMPLSSLPGCGVPSYHEYALSNDKNDLQDTNIDRQPINADTRPRSRSVPPGEGAALTDRSGALVGVRPPSAARRCEAPAGTAA